MLTQIPPSARSVVLELDALQWATETNAVEAVLGRRPGVISVEANAVSQTATVTFDPTATTVVDLAGWVRDCGYHCAGESVPDHLCVPTPATGELGKHDGAGHDGAGHDATAGPTSNA